jgi:hypothetical protein
VPNSNDVSGGLRIEERYEIRYFFVVERRFRCQNKEDSKRTGTDLRRLHRFLTLTLRVKFHHWDLPNVLHGIHERGTHMFGQPNWRFRGAGRVCGGSCGSSSAIAHYPSPITSTIAMAVVRHEHEH